MIKTLNYIINIERVHHPDHYQGCSEAGAQILFRAEFPHPPLLKEECINVIEALELDFCLGNCFKYLWRLDKKKNFFFFTNIREDLQKSHWYVDRYISRSHEKGNHVEPWIYNLKTENHKAILQEIFK